MPYALFCQKTQISKAYIRPRPTCGSTPLKMALSSMFRPTRREPTPKRVLDNDYTIRPCEPDLKEKHDPTATDIVLPVTS